MKIVKINPTFRRFLVFLKKYFYVVIAVLVICVISISIIESKTTDDTDVQPIDTEDRIYSEQVNVQIDLSNVNASGSTNELMSVLISNYGMYLQESNTRKNISKELTSRGMDPYYEYGDEKNNIHYDTIYIARHSSSVYAYIFVTSDDKERTEAVSEITLELLQQAPETVSLGSKIVLSEIKLIEPEDAENVALYSAGGFGSFWLSVRGIAAIIFAIVLGLVIILIMSALSSKIYLDTEIENAYGIKFIDIKNEKAFAFRYGKLAPRSIKVVRLFNEQVPDLKQDVLDVVEFDDLEIDSKYHYWILVKLGKNKLIEVNNIMEKLKVFDIEIEGYITV